MRASFKQLRFVKLSTTALIALACVCAAAQGAEFGGTLKKISDAGAITIGHRDSSQPFSFLDRNKQPAGYAIDLCLKIVDEVKTVLSRPDLEVKYVAVNPKTRIALVADGTVDMECGTTTNTLARQQQVDFSAVYFTTGTRLLTWKTDNVSEIENLAGKVIAVVGGSTNEKAVKALVENGQVKGAKLVAISDYAEGLGALQSKKVDAFATDDIVLFGLLAKSDKKQDLEIVGRYLTYDPYGIMFRRGDADFRLAVNRALARVFRSGEISRIYEKWFGPMEVPMSQQLKAGFELQAIPE